LSALAEHALAFAFGCATPDAVADVVVERVREAFRSDRAIDAYSSRRFDPDALGREEGARVEPDAARVLHPRVRRPAVERVQQRSGGVHVAGLRSLCT